MGSFSVVKSIAEINEKIKTGKVVVVTAEEMTALVKKEGEVAAARKVDVVTTGTFGPMCSSGAFLNFGHTKPRIRASKILINRVPAYGGVAAVDLYIGATEPTIDDPLNKVFPGQFPYGGGHVIQDLVSGKRGRARSRIVRHRLLSEPWPEKGHAPQGLPLRDAHEPPQRLPELQRGGQHGG